MSCVPPSHWTRKIDAEPDALIDATEDDPFETALLQGWTTALARFVARDPDSRAWIAPLWKHWAGRAARLEEKGRDRAAYHLRILLPIMDQKTAESSVLALIKDKAIDVYVLSLLDMLPRPWGSGFSQEYLALARGVLSSSADNRGYSWGNTLLTAARALPRESFAAALDAWPLQEDATAGPSRWAEREIERFHEIIRMRQSLYEELNQNVRWDKRGSASATRLSSTLRLGSTELAEVRPKGARRSPAPLPQGARGERARSARCGKWLLIKERFDFPHARSAGGEVEGAVVAEFGGGSQKSSEGDAGQAAADADSFDAEI